MGIVIIMCKMTRNRSVPAAVPGRWSCWIYCRGHGRVQQVMRRVGSVSRVHNLISFEGRWVDCHLQASWRMERLWCVGARAQSRIGQRRREGCDCNSQKSSHDDGRGAVLCVGLSFGGENDGDGEAVIGRRGKWFDAGFFAKPRVLAPSAFVPPMAPSRPPCFLHTTRSPSRKTQNTNIRSIPVRWPDHNLAVKSTRKSPRPELTPEIRGAGVARLPGGDPDPRAKLAFSRQNDSAMFHLRLD